MSDKLVSHLSRASFGSTSGSNAAKRRVSWDTDMNTIRHVERHPTNQSIATVGTVDKDEQPEGRKGPQEEKEEKLSCFEGCLLGFNRLCGLPDEVEIVRTYLWKLSSNAEHLDEFASWRRRLFILRKTVSYMGLFYVSEKDDGVEQLLVIFHGKGRKKKSVVLETQEDLEMQSLSPDAKRDMIENLKNYDLAFGEDQRYVNADEYENKIPKVFFPFKFSWDPDPSGDSTAEATLAASNKLDLQEWMRELSAVCTAGS